MELTHTEHRMKCLTEQDVCPLRHIVIEEKKEVWFVGSFPSSMAVPILVNRHFPGYKGCLATEEDWLKLKERYGAEC